LTAADVSRALVVRKGIRALLRANSGGELDEAAVDRLDQAAMGAHLQVRFSRDGSSRFESLSRTFDGALGYLLGILMSTRIAGDWPRFKLCADGKCGAAFYDHSKNGKGRWCKVRCGDRVRSSVYRRGDKYKSGRGSSYVPRF
jgi:predicted RNA-binding Zn ribbon-like protein